MADAAWMLSGCACLAALAGCAWLALAMEGHWQQVHARAGPAPAVQWLLRVLGAAGLLVSLGLCFAADRPSMAVLVWVMLLAAGASSVAMALAWRPTWLRCLWPVHRIDPTVR